MLRKVLAGCLVLVMALSLCSCEIAEPILKSVLGDVAGEKIGELLKDPAQKQYECGKSAYDSLTRSEDICVQMADVVYEAWYFAIYDAEDYSSDSSRISAFAEEVGLTKSELRTAFKNCLDTDECSDSLLSYALSEFSYAVEIACQAYVDKGLVAELDAELANAKDQLKIITEEYPDYSEYPMLKTYYAKVNSYAEFVKDPTGSFNQLSSTVETYEREIRDCRRDLEIVFE
jgi:hypothetical protein